MSAEIPVLMTQLRAGKIKAVGIFSAQRSEIFPDLPTFAELGFPGALAENWQAVFAPARTPPQVIAKLSRAFRAAIDDPDVQARLIQVGVTPQPGGPEELGTTLRGEIDRYGRLLREHNIQAQTE
jgi:tripartite-type tricarboxylate transporter receptor subunit TctC